MKTYTFAVVSNRNGKSIITFNCSYVPSRFFTLCKDLGIVYHVTGGNELTHEVELTTDEFDYLISESLGI